MIYNLKSRCLEQPHFLKGSPSFLYLFVLSFHSINLSNFVHECLQAIRLQPYSWKIEDHVNLLLPFMTIYQDFRFFLVYSFLFTKHLQAETQFHLFQQPITGFRSLRIHPAFQMTTYQCPCGLLDNLRTCLNFSLW